MDFDLQEGSPRLPLLHFDLRKQMIAQSLRDWSANGQERLSTTIVRDSKLVFGLAIMGSGKGPPEKENDMGYFGTQSVPISEVYAAKCMRQLLLGRAYLVKEGSEFGNGWVEMLL